jgi:hypothetical protein
MQAATFQISKLHEEQITKGYLEELLPLTTLRKHQAMSRMGLTELASHLMSTLN